MLSLVTGVGARGQVGEAVAAALADRGDTTLVVARSEDEARSRARELAGRAGAVHGYGCDLANGAEVTRLAARVQDEHGDRLDALVNLAGGFGLSGPLDRSDPLLLDRLIDINLRTAFFATRAFLPLVRRARGSIVFFASEVVLEATRTRGVAAYTAAKSAVVGLMRSVADEGAPEGVRANALAPGTIRTTQNLQQLGPDATYVEREQLASAVAWLCSAESSAVTGQVIRISPVSR